MTHFFNKVLEFCKEYQLAYDDLDHPNSILTLEGDRDPVSDKDIELLERVVAAEGRGEGVDCQEAIATVMLNRWQDGSFGDTLTAVITSDGQFADPYDGEISIATHLAFAGSLRKGEILALTWDDVDFQKGTISVSKTLKRVRRDAVNVLNGKDILYQFPAVFDEGRTVTVLKRPKTKSSIRTIYLPDYVLDALQKWKEILKPVKRNHPDLILRYSNGRPLSEETLPRLLEKQLLQLGLPTVSFHSLRHSSISYKLVLTGGNIKAVQGDSGHAQAEMIAERYGHIIDSCRKQCA